MRTPARAVRQPRLDALYATRQWLLLLLVTVAWILAALVGISRVTMLSNGERLCLLLGAGCLTIAWLLRRHSGSLVVLIVAPLLLVVAAWLSPPMSPVTWIALASSVSQVAFGVVLLAGRWLGLLGITGSVALLALIWNTQPSNVIAGTLLIANGWVSFAVVAASALALWFAWHRLLEQAQRVDRRVAAWEGITESAREQQQRARVWREAVAHVHETLLTTIRYVMQAREVDPSGLRRWRADQESATSLHTDWKDTVEQATAGRIGAGIVDIDESLADLSIPAELREPLRAVVFEGVSNAVRHGHASQVKVTGGTDAQGMWIRLQDNGRGLPADTQPGIGWSAVLDQQLAAVGGAWSIRETDRGTELTLRVPRVLRADRLGSGDDGFEQGRILMTWPLLALSLVSVIYCAFLPLGVIARVTIGTVLALGIVLGLSALLSAGMLARRITPGVALGVSGVPILLLALEFSSSLPLFQITPVQVSALAAMLQAAGYTVIVLGLWSRLSVALVCLVLWGMGAIALALALPGELRTPLLVALANCLVVMPLVAGISRIGTRRFVLAQEVVLAERSRIMLEAMRAQVARSMNESLDSCVGEANAIIDDISVSGHVDGLQLRRLALLDGLIRATIQVDPVLHGGFAQTGSEIVARGFQAGVGFDVRVIDASLDMRPLDRGLVELITNVVTSCDSEGRLQVFHDEREDFLVLTLRWSAPDLVPVDSLTLLSAWRGAVAVGTRVEVDVSTAEHRPEVTLTVVRSLELVISTS